MLFLPAMLFFLLHVATNGQYGFHRDELQTLDDARHLDWGFVVYPPVTPLIGRLELILFGTSLTGFRVFSALAMSAIMVLAGLMAKELGGKRHAQLLTAIAAGIAPVSLIQGAVFQYVSFDYLWGVTVTCFLIRLLKSDDTAPSGWPLAASSACGMETRSHHGRFGSRRGGRGVAHACPAMAAERLALGRRRPFHPDLSAQSHLAGAASLHLSRVLVLSARPAICGRRALRRILLRSNSWVNVNVVAAPLAIVGYGSTSFIAKAGATACCGWMFVVSFVILIAQGSYGRSLETTTTRSAAGWMAWSRETSPRACRSTRRAPTD